MGFFSDLFGGSQRKDLRRAKAKSDAELTAGYNEAQPFYDKALGLYQPYADIGLETTRRYNALLGGGTPEERAAAQDFYANDPGFQGMLGEQSNALLRKMNAYGQGTNRARLAEAGARVGREAYGDYLNRLSGFGGQGFAAAGNQAGIQAGRGDMRFGLGATRAGQEVNFGNALAGSRNTGINNLLGIVGTAAKVGTSFPALFSDIRLKRDIEHVGHLPSGLPVYRFKYNWSDDVYEGVMAHEAAEYFPDAVSYSDDGFAMVDYSKVN